MEKQQTTEKAVDTYMPDHRLECVLSPKWLRVYFGGETVADSRRVILLRESGRLPVYYFPQEDVRMDLLRGESSDADAPCVDQIANFGDLRRLKTG